MGEELKVADLLKVLTGPDRIRIIKDKAVIHTGYLAMLPEEYKAETVKRFCTFPEIRHKEWKARGLMAPMEPDETPKYSFSDLEMKIYYDIHI